MKKEELLNEMYQLVRRFDKDLLELMNLMRNNGELSDEIPIENTLNIMSKNAPVSFRVGDVCRGNVCRIYSMVGAFIQLSSTKEGMIHISRLGQRVNRIEDVLNIGDEVEVEVIKIGEKGMDLRLIRIL